MVLSIFCNDDKLCEKKVAVFFGINVSQNIIVSSNSFRCNFGEVVVILSVAPTVSCSVEQSFSVLRRPKRNLRSIVGQDRLCHLALLCIERA